MFREVMNFAYRRSALQAFGWYLTFLLIGILIGALAGAIFIRGATSFAEGVRQGIPVGQWVIIPYHLVLAGALLWTRWRSVASILLALAGLLVSAFLGALGGLIPLAILTTRPSQKSHKEIGQVFE